MAKWHLLCAISDYPGTGRARQGDIMDVWPAARTIPDFERKNFLIVVADNLTEYEASMLTKPQYSDGVDEIDYQAEKTPTRTIVAKRKHAIPISKMSSQLSSFSQSRMEDPNDDYQPYLTEKVEPDAKSTPTIYDKHNASFRTVFTPEKETL